jgi:hypothetical protein
VRLNLLAHLRNHAPGGLGKQLGQGIRGDALNYGRGDDDQDERRQQTNLAFADHIIDQVFGRARENQAGEAVHDHEAKTEGQNAAARFDQLQNIGKLFPIELLLGGFAFAGFFLLARNLGLDFIEAGFLLAAGADFHGSTITRFAAHLTVAGRDDSRASWDFATADWMS